MMNPDPLNKILDASSEELRRGETAGLESIFFFNDAATPDIYTLSLHDPLPIYGDRLPWNRPRSGGPADARRCPAPAGPGKVARSLAPPPAVCAPRPRKGGGYRCADS